MEKVNLHCDPGAERLWRRCHTDANLRWLLEGVLATRRPELGRILLISPVEVFGETQARVGRKLSLIFRLSGLPYISGNLTQLSTSLRRRLAESEQARNAKRAIAEWQGANARQAQYTTVAAILDMVRRNPVARELVMSGESVTPVRVAQVMPELEALDWKPMSELVQLLEPLLARPRSKKPINRFTLNFTALLRSLQPEVSLQAVAMHSAHHFVNLLKKRKVSQGKWRRLLLALIERDLVAPYIPTFLWCRKFPDNGFVASLSLSSGTFPPCCPWCGKDAHAIGSFLPAGCLRDAMTLKDGLLGAAVGWHLIKTRVLFSHDRCEGGIEMDFVISVPHGRLLVECKAVTILGSTKQLMRNVRDAVKQLDDHAAQMGTNNVKLLASICVVNLTSRDLASLQRESPSMRQFAANRVISYEQFAEWLAAKAL